MKRVLTSVLAVVMLLSLCACGGETNKDKYNKACKLLDKGEYAEAKTIFVDLGDYEDSAEKVKECDYQSACQLMSEEKYAEAKVIFDALGDYEDSAEKAKECEKIQIDQQLQGRWAAGFDAEGIKAIFVIKDGRVEALLEISGETQKLNEGSYRIDLEKQEVNFTYDYIYSVGASGTVATPNTKEQKMFTYTFVDGVLELKTDTYAYIRKE